MNRPFVEELHIQNFGCIRDATFKLSPLHALIGPNDSGKSTVLRALRLLSDFARNGGIGVDGRYGRSNWRVAGGGQRFDAVVGGGARRTGSKEEQAALVGCQLLRLEPDALRKSSALIPEGHPLHFFDEHGTGLPAV
ncbi:MAG TPA: AAA family ATPase, partial [Polyangiaceae bacterium]|nr:AAA family ATPase [Polyangiaceae bacterium]